MSCIRKQIVLRIPADCVGVPDAQTYYDYENAHPGVLDFEVGHLSYSLSSTEKQQYFDYWLLDKDMPKASALDCYAKSRPLTSVEKERYRFVFQLLSPDVDMDRVRYCEYVWYDGIEAPVFLPD